MQLDSELMRVFVAVLVPMIPAFILYKYLPSQAGVEGTYLYGLKINLAGAFAGYFVIMLSVFGWFQMHPVQTPPDKAAVPDTELWTVKGSIKMPAGAAKSDVRLSIFPGFRINQQGQFTIEVPVRRLRDGSLDFPSLQVDVHGREESVDLAKERGYGAQYKPTHNDQARTIRIDPEIAIPLGASP